MKITAIVVGIIAASFIVGACSLFIITIRFYLSDGYAPFSGIGISRGGYSGVGVFIPSFILFAIGFFLAKFARNLWRP
jgi:hypothetical protein